jgi:D-alanyl-D-alanine carboxypeptidase
MMRRLILLCSSLFLTMPIHAQVEIARLDSLMRTRYPDGAPGAAIAVVKHGEVVFKRGYGVADLVSRMPITSSTNFNICSMTKQFTAFAILQLERAGKLSLDEKLRRFFSGLPSRLADSVTVRQLLTHSSGLVDHYDHVDRSKYTEFWDKDILTVARSVDSLYFTPGTHYRYSNGAYCLLSLIVEQLSGQAYPAYLRDHVFGPLKMSRSDVIRPDFRVEERAIGYEAVKDSFKVSDAKESLFFSTQGDGGVYTSIDDYLKWVVAIQQKSLPGPELMTRARSPQFPIDTTRHMSYGFGWFVAGSGATQLIYHTGSNGGFRTIVLTKPSEEYAVVIFSNRTGVDLEDLVREVDRMLSIDDSAFVKLDSLIS